MKKTTRLIATTVAAATILGSFTCSLSAASNHRKLPAKFKKFGECTLTRYDGGKRYVGDETDDGILDPSDATFILRYVEAKNDAIKNHKSRFFLQTSKNTWRMCSCQKNEAYFLDHFYVVEYTMDVDGDEKVTEKDARLVLEYYNWCCVYDLDPSTYAAEAVKNGWLI